MQRSGWLLRRVVVFSIVLSLLLPFSTTGDVIQEGEVHWQLYNQASEGFLQVFMGHISARGLPKRKCFTEFRVTVSRSGAIQLINVQSNTFICFNRRRRITARFEGMSARCHFYERINNMGYTELESAAEPGLFLGFNSRGRFQDPSTYKFRRKAFNWVKFERYVPYRELQHCSVKKRPISPPVVVVPKPDFHAIMRASLLDKIRATHDDPYTPYDDELDNSV